MENSAAEADLKKPGQLRYRAINFHFPRGRISKSASFSPPHEPVQSKFSHTVLLTMALPPKILIVGGGVFGCKSSTNTLYSCQWHIGTRTTLWCHQHLSETPTQIQLQKSTCQTRNGIPTNQHSQYQLPCPSGSATPIRKSPWSNQHPSPTHMAHPWTHRASCAPTMPMPHTADSQTMPLSAGARLLGVPRAGTRRMACC